MTAPTTDAGTAQECRHIRQTDPAAIRAVLVLDEGVFIVRRDGSLEAVIAGGHPRPGLAHSMAGRRS